MGNGASAGVAAATTTASAEDLKAALGGLSEEAREKLRKALSGEPSSSLNILLQEDLVIRGGAQLWLMNCGSRLHAAGHNVTFLLPTTSLIVDDCKVNLQPCLTCRAHGFCEVLLARFIRLSSTAAGHRGLQGGNLRRRGDR